MKIILTPAILEAAYDLLRVSAPFKGWKLPPADDVKFVVIAGKDRAADYYVDGDTPVFRMSQNDHRSLRSVIETLAHEMCHLREDQLGTGRNDVEHGATFKRLGRQVCSLHGFDPGTFKGLL